MTFPKVLKLGAAVAGLLVLAACAPSFPDAYPRTAMPKLEPVAILPTGASATPASTPEPVSLSAVPSPLAPSPPVAPRSTPVFHAPDRKPMLNELIMPDGARLPTRVFLPDGRPKAVVVALHGFNDYSNAFAEAGAAFADAGVATYAYDQRGFGAAPNPGEWPGEDQLVDDLRAATELVASRHPGVPVYLLGESMGGAVVMAAMTGPNPPKAAGVVLAAPAVWGRETMGFFPRVALWLFSHVAPWLNLSGSGLNIRPSDNDAMLRRLGRDPLVIKETKVSAIYGLVDLMDTALASAPRLKVPALILYGAHDEIVPAKPTCLMIENLPPRPPGQWRVGYYQDGFHMLLRDLKGDIVVNDVATWLLNPTAALPSGSEVLKPEPDGGTDMNGFLLCRRALG